MKHLFLGLLLANLAFASSITLPSGYKSWKAPVTNAAALPSSGNTTGDCRVAKATNSIYCWSGSAWVAIAGGGGSGNVTGPASSVAHNLAGYADTSGILLEDSGLAASAMCTLTGTQALTNKTVDGVSPTTMGYVDATSSIQTQLNGKLASAGTGLVESLSGLYKGTSIADGCDTIDEKAAYAYTINTLAAESSAGTVSLSVKINGVVVTGISTLSVTSTQATATASAANSVVVGDKVQLCAASTSSAADVAWTLKATR